MIDIKKYKSYVDNLINNTPDFMMLDKDNEKYILLDRLVVDLSENAMPWLFKVYLQKQYNILQEDNISDYMKQKYEGIDIVNKDGNLFFNDKMISAILKELEDNSQLEYLKEENTYKLI